MIMKLAQGIGQAVFFLFFMSATGNSLSTSSRALSKSSSTNQLQKLLKNLPNLILQSRRPEWKKKLTSLNKEMNSVELGAASVESPIEDVLNDQQLSKIQDVLNDQQLSKIEDVLSDHQLSKIQDVLNDQQLSNTEDVLSDHQLSKIQEEVKWRDSSAKIIKAYLTENVKIRCEMWAPLGSSVKWLKDGKMIRKNSHPIPNMTLNHDRNYYDTIRSNSREENSVEIKTRDWGFLYKFHIMSIINLDCLRNQDLGLYEIVIETPSGFTYTRNFNVQSLGQMARPTMLYCWPQWSIKDNYFDPRITEFAKSVVAKQGHALTLPCRSIKLHDIAVTWDRKDRRITEENFGMTNEGDLIIKQLTKEDQGIYSCEISDSQYNYVYDEISTFVEVRD